MHTFNLRGYFKWALLTIFVLATGPVCGLTVDDFQLSAEVMGGRKISVDPRDYPEDVTADFYKMERARQEQFLSLRREKLEYILKGLKGRILETSEDNESPNWIDRKLQTLLATIDALLFKNCTLLTSPDKENSMLYSAQAVAYWGFGTRVKGIGVELSLLRQKRLDGRMQTKITLDKVQFLKAYVPVPAASVNFRMISFTSLNSSEDNEMANTNIHHLPLGLITATGDNQVGLGFASGITLPPFPIGTITAFTSKRVTSKILYVCEKLLTASK